MNNLFESAQFTGKNLVVLDSVDSTNKYASARLQSGDVKEGSAFLAEFQSEGRGQQGTVWESESGKNLIVSFVFYPQFLLATDQFMLSKAVALAAFETVSHFLQNAERIKIKWPNDILVDGRKIAGILIENILVGDRLKQSIVGIGMNINQEKFAPEMNAISLIQILHKSITVTTVFDFLCNALEHHYFLLKAGKTRLLDEKYLANLHQFEKEADYLYKNEKIRAKITGIDLSGRLQLFTNTNENIIADLKEISFLP